MPDTLSPGLKTRKRYEIDERRTTNHQGEGLGVYATPAMVLDVEVTCNELVRPLLDEGQATVGTRVEIDHLAPTPSGAWVEVQAELVEVDDRKLAFDVVIVDAVEQVGRAKHKRFIVDTDRARKRLGEKWKKIEAAG